MIALISYIIFAGGILLLFGLYTWWEASKSRADFMALFYSYYPDSEIVKKLDHAVIIRREDKFFLVRKEAGDIYPKKTYFPFGETQISAHSALLS